MRSEEFELFEKTPGECEEIPKITAYIPDNKKSDGAIVILPGGGYGGRTGYEGEDYAKFFTEHGITAFVCSYRVAPHRFPLPLLDSRQAVRFVRHNSEKYGLDKEKVYIMGSSAGGHLAALTSTYKEELELEDKADKENCIPNGQILCYPVIGLMDKEKGHIGSGKNLLGDKLEEMADKLNPCLIADKDTPRAFIWHTFNDGVVNVINSLEYAESLRRLDVSAEVHIFPEGEHGLGLALNAPYVAQWKGLLLKWLEFNGFFNKD